MTEDILYLDAAASARPIKAAVDEAARIAMEDYANPGAIHGFGDSCNRLIEKARKRILNLLVGENASQFDCIFTSGATEGNNLAILGAARANSSYSKRIVTTGVEHDSVSKVVEMLKGEGFTVDILPVNADGSIPSEAIESALSQPACLFTVISVSNQNGALLPVEDLARKVKKALPRAVFHTDATQAIGKVKLDWSLFDLVTFSGHKIGGLRGTGALIKRKKTRLDPPEVGGGQELGLRSGTLNTPGDCALATALEESYRTLNQRRKNAEEFKAAVLEGIQGLDEVVNLSPSGVPFVTALGLKTRKASTVVQYLSSLGIYISTTSACDVRKDEPNRILRSMGFESHVADNPLRISISGETEGREEGERFAKALREAVAKLRPER